MLFYPLELMPPKVHSRLAEWGIVISVIAGLAGLVGAWFVIPYRVEAAEKAIEKLKAEVQSDHDVIIRLDANVIRMDSNIRWIMEQIRTGDKTKENRP